jgi:hypothetical protein
LGVLDTPSCMCVSSLLPAIFAFKPLNGIEIQPLPIPAGYRTCMHAMSVSRSADSSSAASLHAFALSTPERTSKGRLLFFNSKCHKRVTARVEPAWRAGPCKHMPACSARTRAPGSPGWHVTSHDSACTTNWAGPPYWTSARWWHDAEMCSCSTRKRVQLAKHICRDYATSLRSCRSGSTCKRFKAQPGRIALAKPAHPSISSYAWQRYELCICGTERGALSWLPLPSPAAEAVSGPQSAVISPQPVPRLPTASAVSTTWPTGHSRFD